MTNDELNQQIINGIKAGKFVALLENGEMIFYHIEHTDDEMLKDALPLNDVERLLLSGEAE